MTKKEINHINSSDVNIEEVSKGMKQYLEIKRQYQDSILLYRLGDFYETFFEDAIKMSKELELTLTGRESGPIIGRVPLAGIPAKSLDVYLEKLVQKNLKVAICEQLEDPKDAEGIVKRGVTRVITAGTLVESSLLEQNSNNYICAVYKDKKSDLYGFSYADISTGEFKSTQAPLNLIISELARIKPSEIIAPGVPQKVMPFQIVPEEKIDLPEQILLSYNCSKIPESVFATSMAENNIKAAFRTTSLDGFGFDQCKLGFRAAGAIVAYIWENMKEGFPKFDRMEIYELSEYMMMDVSTRKNLELIETLREKNKYGSLLWAIDQTKTNMGARLLRSWICQPLKSVESIIKRQNAIEELIQEDEIRRNLIDSLEKVYDIQRLSTRLSNGTASPRDFLSLKSSLYVFPDIIEAAKDLKIKLFEHVSDYAEELTQFTDIIERTIDENPPITIKDGGIIKEGCSADLDYLKNLVNHGEDWLKEFEEREKEKTGIKFLKVGYNRVFGYFIEVTNSNINMVPNNYVRKQTLSNAERYITEELKAREDEILNSQFKARELEYKLYSDFKSYAKEYVTKIREVADAIAQADILSSFAETALENNYIRPIIDESNDFIIKNGRHPVLEKILPLGQYVANDIELAYGGFRAEGERQGDEPCVQTRLAREIQSDNKTEFMILTGPNMAGKSTFMRQNALITILAQIGSFVPADYAKIGIVDKIFTRVGASDDLTLGQSTFMVEMVETAYILNSATEKSLILLDEIGRGTSTYDGVAIAWSVAEFIATEIKARCIFATHYHELNVMTNTYPQIKNYRITVVEENGEIEFLRKIVPGGASKSYGIQVAKMAGLPSSVVARSQDLMTKMQKNFSNNLSGRKKSDSNDDELPQLNLF